MPAGKPERDDYTAGVLARVGRGASGLSVVERDFGVPRRPMPGIEVVYRTPDGRPVAVALAAAGKVYALVTDKSRGLLSARAAVAVMRVLQKYGAVEPAATYTPDAERVMRRRGR